MPEESQNQPNDPITPGSDEFPVDDDSPETFPGAAQPEGNRPAEGARQGSPDEMLSAGFEGSENAGDFLGLDLEFTGAMPDSGSQAAPAPPDITPAELELSEAVSLATDETTDTDYDAEFDLDGPTQIMHADEDAYGDDAEFEDEYGDEFDESLEPAATGGRGKMIALALGAGIVAFLGITVGPKFLSKSSDDGAPRIDQVVRNTEPAKDVAPDPTSDPEPTAPVTPTDDVAAVEPSAGTEDSSAADPLAAAAAALTAANSANQGEPAADTGAESFEPSSLDILLAGDTDPSTDAGSVDPSVAASVGLAGTQADDAFPTFDVGYEWVSEDMLDMVWRGTSVPMEAIAAPARTLMPRVGHVRVHMLSGQTIDGRLYAVGQERVWLDIQPGRVGLDGTAVERFEHLAVDSLSSGAPSTTSPVPMSGRVSIEVPGGLIYGQIIAQREGSTTLVCDDGGKITIRNAVVKPVTTNRALLVQR